MHFHITYCDEKNWDTALPFQQVRLFITAGQKLGHGLPLL